jgi:hypothetical protein
MANAAWVDGRGLTAAQIRQVIKGFSKRDTKENPQNDIGGLYRLVERPTDVEWLSQRMFLLLHGKIVSSRLRCDFRPVRAHKRATE